MTTTTSTTSTSAASTSLKTTSIATLLGAGSGIDMAALANNLATAQFEYRSSVLTSKQDALNTKISTASNIKSQLLALDTSLGTLVRSGDLARTPTVANSSVATASLSGTSQPNGSYALEVTQIAKGQQLNSSTFASSSSTVGAGTLTIKFGATTASSFTEDLSKASIDITVASGDTLSDVASAINASDAGIYAYVATNSAGTAQLVLKGSDGEANGFTIEATEDSGDPGLSALAWSPGSTTYTHKAVAVDAEFNIDGIDYSSSSNTVTDPVPGLKLVLTGSNIGSPTTISFNDPGDSITTTMQDLVDALNEVMSSINTATAVGGDLATDPGTRALKKSLMQLAGTTVMPNATGAAKTLADLGLKTQRDGTFALDTSRLKATLEADPEGVSAMFTNGLYGVYATVDKIYLSAASSTNTGSLTGSIKKYNDQLDQLAEDLTKIADQQEALRARLSSQFTASESRIATLKSTQTMLQNQIDAWNNSGN